MNKSMKRSSLLVGMAAIAGLVLPLALPAGAALKSSAVCKKLTAPPLSQSGGKVKTTLSSCTPAALAKGGGSVISAPPKGTKKGSYTSTITWAGGKGKTVAVVQYAAQATKGKCPAPYDTRIKVTGSVKSATGAAAKITKKGEPVSGSVCAVTKGPKIGQSSLEPGTTFKQ
jgi:hypothetical protein